MFWRQICAFRITLYLESWNERKCYKHTAVVQDTRNCTVKENTSSHKNICRSSSRQIKPLTWRTRELKVNAQN